ncbi:RNA-binding protein [Klebsormidium nitens]|uniref:RNA-binding protein n=1 Tax=Klebsormidium nitens TaxID=105231 RepID=A0A1Y1I998_KLENI|nr:RNA-binding protein [Klebsormidium nitens]|eukprot:GAQ85266.1 RNA-binding protein [Klebsormidium nitens]
MDGSASTSYGGYYSSIPQLFPTEGQGPLMPPPEEPPPPPAETPPLPQDVAPPPPLSPRSGRRQKARRTVSVQDVPPTVGTEEVLYSAFAQFGKVESVYIARNYLDSSRNPECIGTALVRFGTEEQARKVIQETTEKLYMVGGMPRPIMACIADESQLPLEEDTVQEPAPLPVKLLGRSSDALELEFAMKWRQLHRRQQAERAVLKKMNAKKEKELAEKQEKIFKEIYERYEIVRRTNHSQGVEQLKRVLSRR